MDKLEVYLESKKYSWSISTISSARSRLLTAIKIDASSPKELYEALVTMDLKPYSIKTLMIQYSSMMAFFNDYSYKEFIKNNANLFKNAYTKEQLNITYEEALKKIELINHLAARRIALAILRSGMRAHEALKYDGSGSVIGKGSKARSIFINEDLTKEELTYKELYVELKKVGLKPHSLRKLTATRLVDKGFKEADLMKVMGWNSITTASSYLQASRDAELKERMASCLS